MEDPLYKSDRNKKTFLKAKKKGRIPTHTTIRCPENGLQVSWCRMLCTPVDNLGTCGRLAPHSMKDRTQQAIALHMAKAS